MKKTLAALALVVIALAAYFALWPLPVEPVGWPAPPAPGYTGPHAVNQGLARLQHIDLKGEAGPEHVAIGPDGKLYAAVDRRQDPAHEPGRQRARRCSRGPAGASSASTSTRRGTWSAPTRFAWTRLNRHGRQGDGAHRQGGRRPDPLCGCGGGRAQWQYLLQRRFDPFLAPGKCGGIDGSEHAGTSLSSPPPAGCWSANPATKKTRVIARGFSFANGIALSQDEQWLFVAETGRLPHLEGVRAGQQAGAGAARQPARLSGQPDARAGRKDLGGPVSSRAIRRRRQACRTSLSCAR